LSAPPTIAPSPSKTLQNALHKRGTLRALLVYITSAILLTFLHVLMAYAYTYSSPSPTTSTLLTTNTNTNTNADSGWDPKLTPFVRSKKHPYYLNGRFVFLLLAQVVLAGTFWIRNVMLDRFAFRSVSSVSYLLFFPFPLFVPSMNKSYQIKLNVISNTYRHPQITPSPPQPSS
jgi:nucleoporin NDC1